MSDSKNSENISSFEILKEVGDRYFTDPSSLSDSEKALTDTIFTMGFNRIMSLYSEFEKTGGSAIEELEPPERLVLTIFAKLLKDLKSQREEETKNGKK